MTDPKLDSRRKLVWFLVIVLAVVHYDFWYWKDDSLVMGFLPIGLFFHALFSLSAAAVWSMAVKYCWPTHLEEWADGGTPDDPRGQ